MRVTFSTHNWMKQYYYDYLRGCGEWHVFYSEPRKTGAKAETPIIYVRYICTKILLKGTYIHI